MNFVRSCTIPPNFQADCNMMSSGDHLPSGTYVIQAQDYNVMIADPDTSDSPVKTASGSEKDQTYKV